MRLHPYLRRAGAAPLRAPRAVRRRSPPATTSAPTAPATTAASAGDQLDFGARLLAAADAYHAMTEDRPHRPALTRGRRRVAAASTRSTPAGSGAPRSTPCSPPPARRAARRVRSRPAGLTEREVDVLRLIARGHANKQVAATLGISPKTVGHHIEHIYAKAGVTTRAGATLFAMEHGLLSP